MLECLRTRGALFFHDLVAATGRLGVEVTEALWDLVARGLVTADGFGSVRALFSARHRWSHRAARSGPAERLRLRRSGARAGGGEGRWALVPPPPPTSAVDVETLAEAVAEQLLARWGVVFRDLVARETLAVSWREVLWAFRRLEARGTIRGGRFVTGFVGEQYALPEAVEGLRETRRRERSGEIVRVAAVDPLNLVGILTPGPRVPADPPSRRRLPRRRPALGGRSHRPDRAAGRAGDRSALTKEGSCSSSAPAVNAAIVISLATPRTR